MIHISCKNIAFLNVFRGDFIKLSTALVVVVRGKIHCLLCFNVALIMYVRRIHVLVRCSRIQSKDGNLRTHVNNSREWDSSFYWGQFCTTPPHRLGLICYGERTETGGETIQRKPTRWLPKDDYNSESRRWWVWGAIGWLGALLLVQ